MQEPYVIKLVTAVRGSSLKAPRKCQIKVKVGVRDEHSSLPRNGVKTGRKKVFIKLAQGPML